jgi:hypothetical protein
MNSKNVRGITLHYEDDTSETHLLVKPSPAFHDEFNELRPLVAAAKKRKAEKMNDDPWTIRLIVAAILLTIALVLVTL